MGIAKANGKVDLAFVTGNLGMSKSTLEVNLYDLIGQGNIDGRVDADINPAVSAKSSNLGWLYDW